MSRPAAGALSLAPVKPAPAPPLAPADLANYRRRVAGQSPRSEARRVLANLDQADEVGGEALSLLHHLAQIGKVPAFLADDVARVLRRGIALEMFHPDVEEEDEAGCPACGDPGPWGDGLCSRCCWLESPEANIPARGSL